MELEIVRSVADALAHPVIGVNAKLPGVPRDVTDAVPPDVSIADSTRNGWVARRTVQRGTAAELPALAVSIARPAKLDGNIKTTFRAGEFDVLVEYVARKALSELALQQGLYTLRAALRTFGEFHRNENVAMRQRNGVHLIVCTSILQAPTWAEWDDAVVTAALVCTYTARDIQPLS
jgi:hypothetical protein